MPVVVFVVAARRARSAGGRRGARAAHKERVRLGARSAGGRRGARAPKLMARRAIDGAAPWTSSCGRRARASIMGGCFSGWLSLSSARAAAASLRLAGWILEGERVPKDYQMLAKPLPLSRLRV